MPEPLRRGARPGDIEPTRLPLFCTGHSVFIKEAMQMLGDFGYASGDDW